MYVYFLPLRSAGVFVTDSLDSIGQPDIVATVVESVDRISGGGTTCPTQVNYGFMEESVVQTILTSATCTN